MPHDHDMRRFGPGRSDEQERLGVLVRPLVELGLRIHRSEIDLASTYDEVEDAIANT